MKKKSFIIFVFILFILAVHATHKIGDKVIFTYRNEKITGTLKKIKKNKIYIEHNGCIMGYKRDKMSLKDKAKFYATDKEKYENILKKREAIAKQNSEAAKQKAAKMAEALKKSPYKYLGQSITFEQFKKLCLKSVGILYATSSGVVIDMMKDKPNKYLPDECEIGDRGRLCGKILQILNGKILVSSGSYRNSYTYCVDNINTENMVENREYNDYVIMKGAYKYSTVMGASKSVPLLEPLRCPTPKELQEYFNSGNKLYFLKEVTIPASYQKCDKCNGWGKVPKDKGSLTYIECPRCGGMKEVMTSRAQTYYEKVYIVLN